LSHQCVSLCFRYDLHLIFRSIIGHPRLAKSRISILPRTVDTYKSATIYLPNGRQLLFLDSFQFVPSSLGEISKSLRDADLGVLDSVFPDGAQRELLRCKALFCYEYVQSYKTLYQTREMPRREDFFSTLTGELPTEEEYQRGLRVWEVMGCQTLADYMEIYLQLDTILLACFVNKFRKMIFDKYGIELNYFVSASSLTLCSMLKYTQAKIELVSDPTMHVVLTQGAKGGYAGTHKRYATYNEPGTPEYDPSRPETHLLMFDINAVSLPLPSPLACNNP